MSLDIPERQVLLYFGDGAIPYHHRVLLVQIEAACWVVSTPDFDVEVINLSDMTVVALQRKSPFPPRYVADGCYGFVNPILANDIQRLRAEAIALAGVMGVAAPAALLGLGAPAARWRFADTSRADFATEVPVLLTGDVDSFIMRESIAWSGSTSGPLWFGPSPSAWAIRTWRLGDPKNIQAQAGMNELAAAPSSSLGQRISSRSGPPWTVST
jgi:hypothetical protein